MQFVPISNPETGVFVCNSDLDSLVLPNGDRASLLAQSDLARELLDLDVPGITVNSGRHELLCALALFLHKQRAAA